MTYVNHEELGATWTLNLAESTSVVIISASVNRSITRSGWSAQRMFRKAPQLFFKSIWNKEKVPFLPCYDLFTHYVLVFFLRAFSFIWNVTKYWRVEAPPHYVISVFPDVWRKLSLRFLGVQFLLLKCCNPLQHEQVRGFMTPERTMEFSFCCAQTGEGFTPFKQPVKCQRYTLNVNQKM